MEWLCPHCEHVNKDRHIIWASKEETEICVNHGYVGMLKCDKCGKRWFGVYKTVGKYPGSYGLGLFAERESKG